MGEGICYLAWRGHGTPGGGGGGAGAALALVQSNRDGGGMGRVGIGAAAIFRFHDEFSRLACCETVRRKGGGGTSGREGKGTGIIMANYERGLGLT